MKRLSLVVMMAVSLFGPLLACADSVWSQWEFERRLRTYGPDDNFPDGEPPYVPLRHRDAIPEFKWFFAREGATTNQLIACLALAVTNNLSDEVLNSEEKIRVPGNAMWKLSEINHPAVTNFFRALNEIGNPRLGPTPISAPFRYTNLEPEVLAYMRTLCVRTNIYESVSDVVLHDMFRTLDTMPPELKPAATNCVAKFIYYSVRHTTQQMVYQDKRLAGLVPAYSNSIQRLDAMHYVAATATNRWQRTHAQMEADRLSALPAGQLNDLPWIAEEE